MMIKAKMVGYDKFTAKSGNVCVRISLVYPLERREKSIETKGMTAETLFVPDYVASKVSAADLDKEITVVTSYYNNKNNLVDIVR